MYTDLEAIVAQLTGKGKKGKAVDDGFRTTEQLMHETGLTREKILNMLHVLSQADRLESKKIETENIFGARQKTPAYRVKTVTKNGAKKTTKKS
jgi:hypothetical protein